MSINNLFDVPQHWIPRPVNVVHFLHPNERKLTLRKTFDTDEAFQAVVGLLTQQVPGLVGGEFHGHPPCTVYLTGLESNERTITAYLLTDVPDSQYVRPVDEDRVETLLTPQDLSELESWEVVEPEPIIGTIEPRPPQIVTPGPRTPSST